jgi:actin-related protein
MPHDPVIALDNGGCSCKIGLAGTSEPYRHVLPGHQVRHLLNYESLPEAHVHYSDRIFPNAVGRAKGERQSFIGDNILMYKDASSLTLRRPFDRHVHRYSNFPTSERALYASLKIG